MSVTKYDGLPATLMTRSLRERLSHRQEGEFISGIMRIDSMANLLAALGDIRNSSAFPSREAQAREYGRSYKKAMDKAREAYLSAKDNLNSLQANWEIEAEKKAGLHEHVPFEDQREIRAALRSMSDKERDKAISEAAQRGEMHVLQSVRGITPIVTGAVNQRHVNMAVAEAVKAANPHIVGDMEDLDFMRNCVDFAYESFTKAARKMRDPDAEAKGEAQAKATDNALAVIESGGADAAA